MSIIVEALKKAQAAAAPKPAGKKDYLTGAAESRLKKAPGRHVHAYTWFVIISSLIFASVVLLYLTQRDISRLPSQEALPEAGERGYYVDTDPFLDGDNDISSLPSGPEKQSNAYEKPVLTRSRVESAIRLTGIMYTPERPLAVINNSIWRENEKIDDFRIVEIGRDFVRLEADGRDFVVRLKP